MQIEITPLILTFNEVPNIGRTLEKLSWAKEIVLIDSGSTDRTVEIACSAHPRVQVVTRPFDSFAGQCNFGLSHVSTEWVLSMDADYVLTPELVAEIQSLTPSPDIAGYSANFRYCIYGHPLRSTVYPARTVLYRRQLALYRDEGHGHRVTIKGKVTTLSGKIDHDDRKPFTYWLQSQDRYATIEARHLLSVSLDQLSLQDRLRRKIFVAAPAMFVYLLFGRGLILDGWRGWFYLCQRTIAELFLSIRLLLERGKLESNVEH
jgi:glycosyltransferase involved in cell wall biosynthesis